MLNKSLLSTAISLAFGAVAFQAEAALPASPVLDFSDGVGSCARNVGTYPGSCTYGTRVQDNAGSYFSMDLTNVGTFEKTERTPIISAGTGINLDNAQTAGFIDIDWSFGGNLGRHVTKIPLVATSTGANTYNIDMTGWTVNWGNEGDIDMGAGAAATLVCGTACAQGDTFTLDYEATVPTGGFTGINYNFHFEGTIDVDSGPVVGALSTNTVPLAGAIACGTTAQAAGSNANVCDLTSTDIGVSDNGFGEQQGLAQSCIGGCFDFTVSGLANGADAVVVLPLTAAIPTATASKSGHKVVYRKLMSSGWQDFEISGNNRVASMPANSLNPTECNGGDDSLYQNGLNPGHHCVRLTITDGGPNDADGLANGTVVDPGGVSETYYTHGTDGCNMSATPVNAQERADWWLVAGFLALLGMLRFKRNKA